MKQWFSVITLILVGTMVFAEQGNHHKGHHPDDDSYLAAELEMLFDSAGDQSLATLEIGEVKAILGELSVARQKDIHIKHSKQMSFIFPGMGQFMNDDKLNGILFVSADLAIAAGTLIGAYFLLPSNLQFDQLDYLNTDYSVIKQRWEAQTFMEMLPSIGLLAGGMLIQGGLRVWSASHAGKLARANIESGKITFEPTLMMGQMGPESMGFGMHMKY